MSGKTAGNITYTTDGAGSQEQQSNVKLPWRKTINVPSGFAFVSVLAQNGGSYRFKSQTLGSVAKGQKLDLRAEFEKDTGRGYGSAQLSAITAASQACENNVTYTIKVGPQ